MYVRVRGEHLIAGRIEQNQTPENSDRVRFTRLAANSYGLSVRRHTGRWEKTPFSGTLEETLSAVCAVRRTSKPAHRAWITSMAPLPCYTAGVKPRLVNSPKPAIRTRACRCHNPRCSWGFGSYSQTGCEHQGNADLCAYCVTPFCYHAFIHHGARRE
jgi:hypothetical protein